MRSERSRPVYCVCFALFILITSHDTSRIATAATCPAQQSDKKPAAANETPTSASAQVPAAQPAGGEPNGAKQATSKSRLQEAADQKPSEVKTEPALSIENFWDNPVNIYTRTKADSSAGPLPTIQLTFHVCEISKLKENDGETSASKLVPYLNGVPFADAHLDNLDQLNEQIRFSLPISDKARADWAPLLGLPGSEATIGLGWTAVGEKVRAKDKLRIFPATTWRIIVFSVLGLALVIFTLVLAAKTPLLRDAPASAAPVPLPKPRFTYSLARTQMAWWLVISAVSFLYLWAVLDTWSFNAKILTLLGISGATGLSAVLIDSSKQSTAAKQLSAVLTEQPAKIREIAAADGELATISLNEHEEQLAQIARQVKLKRIEVIETQIRSLARLAGPPRPSSSFFRDLLEDKDGISLNRYQLVVWTIILGAMFVYRVLESLQMPAFDDTLLTLLGISGGLYVGFKWPDSKQ